MALLLEALAKAQIVKLVRLANAAEKESNIRRLQRIFVGYMMDLIALLVFSLRPVNSVLVLTMKRTNWKYGQNDINVLLLDVTYENVAVPLLFKLQLIRVNSRMH